MKRNVNPTQTSDFTNGNVVSPLLQNEASESSLPGYSGGFSLNNAKSARADHKPSKKKRKTYSDVAQSEGLSISDQLEELVTKTKERKETIEAFLHIKKEYGSDNFGILYIRCKHEGQYVERSMKVKVYDWQFDPNTEKIIGDDRANEILAKEKERFVKELSDGMLVVSRTNSHVPAIKASHDLIKGRKSLPTALLELFDYEISRLKSKDHKSIARATIQKYTVCRAHMANFLTEIYQRKDIMLKQINKKFVEDFRYYLMDVKKLAHNTAIKRMQIFKGIYKIALDNRWIEFNAFGDVRLILKNTTVEYLEQDEVDRIMNKKLNIPRLDLVRDLFVFSCYTGLAYIDLATLRRKDIKIQFGKPWLVKNRVKTNISTTTPLFYQAKMILEKHQPSWETLDPETLIFKVPTNAKINAYLKEIADICGITKRIHQHLSRHSYAVFLLSQNVPIESVSRMLGHSNIKMTQHYAKVVNQKINRDVEHLERILNEKGEAALMNEIRESVKTEIKEEQSEVKVISIAR